MSSIITSSDEEDDQRKPIGNYGAKNDETTRFKRQLEAVETDLAHFITNDEERHQNTLNRALTVMQKQFAELKEDCAANLENAVNPCENGFLTMCDIDNLQHVNVDEFEQSKLEVLDDVNKITAQLSDVVIKLDKISAIEFVKDALAEKEEKAPAKVRLLFNPTNYWYYSNHLEINPGQKRLGRQSRFMTDHAKAKPQVVKVLKHLKMILGDSHELTPLDMQTAVESWLESRQIAPNTFRLGIYGLYALLTKWNFPLEQTGGPAFRKYLLNTHLARLVAQQPADNPLKRQPHTPAFVEWLWSFTDSIKFTPGEHELELVPEVVTDQAVFLSLMLLQLVTGARSPEFYHVKQNFFRTSMFRVNYDVKWSRKISQPIVASIDVKINKCTLHGVTKHWTILWALQRRGKTTLTPPALAICILRARTLETDTASDLICPLINGVQVKHEKLRIKIKEFYLKHNFGSEKYMASYTTKRTLIVIALALCISPARIQNYITWSVSEMVDRYNSDNHMRFGGKFRKITKNLRTYVQFCMQAHDTKLNKYKPLPEMLNTATLFS